MRKLIAPAFLVLFLFSSPHLFNKLAEITDDSGPVSICEDKCGDSVCQELVCLGTGCPCVETATSCPEDCQTENSPLYVEFTQEQYDSLLGTKPFVLYFHADWCPICRGLHGAITSSIFTFPKKTKILKINYDMETELKQKYGITLQSTFVVLDAEGNIVDSLYNPNLEDLKRVIEMSK